MGTISPGQIYFANQRGLTDTATFMRYSTFTYQSDLDEHRRPFGQLAVLNDYTLAPSKTVTIEVNQNSFVLLIPISGEFEYRDVEGEKAVVDEGGLYLSYMESGSSFTVINTYQAEQISFLHLELMADDAEGYSSQSFGFDFDDAANRLIKVLDDQDDLPFAIHVGRFAESHQALYQLKGADSLFFAFVISGTFNAHGRTLHERDGLALWALESVDIRAESNGAVLLILEFLR
jgi:redox-sensitive bicupin YhaK (pirin superfamily)